MSRLYTYLPKDNTALKDGILSTALADKGFEKYRTRTGKYKKEDTLKVLDSWEPDWTRSKAVSALAMPIPEDAAPDLREFADTQELYSFDLKDLIKAGILVHLRHTRKGKGKRGTYPVEGIDENDKYDWKRKPFHLRFKGIPHYMVETKDGKIPPELIRHEKKADIELRDGDYKSVKKIYDGLSDREKDLLTPRRTVYKDVPVLSRTVAYDGDAPVGFADWYGRKGHASLCVAVADRARGQGLASKMAIDSIRKILARIRAEREQAEREGGDALREWRSRSRLRRFVWGLAAGNDASARAAEKAGFREQLFKRLHKGRRFVLSRADAERIAGDDSLDREKKASAKIDIPALYEEVRKAYADMGYPVSGDRLVLSEQPTYTNGKPVPADVLNPRSSGGNTQHDGTVRINPRYRAVMRHWKLKGPGRDFLRLIIGHELGHHIDRSVLSKSERAEERRRLLREIAKAKFHTVYTDSYGPDTDPRKLDKELLAEYLADMVRRKLEKKAGVKTECLDMEKTASLLRKIKNSIKFRRFLRKYDTSKNFRSVLNGKDNLPRYSHDEVVRLLPDHPLFRGAVKDPIHISGASPSVFGPDKSSTTAGSLVVKPENVMREANNMRHVTPNLTWAKWYINDMSKANGLVSVYDMRKIPELMSGRAGFYEDWEAAKALKNGVFYRKPSAEMASKNLSMTNVAEQTRIPKPGRLPESNAGYDRPETLLDVTRNQPDMVFSIPDDRFTYIDMTPLLDVMRPKQTKIERAMSRLARMKLNKVLNTGEVGRGLVNELHRNYNIPVFE